MTGTPRDTISTTQAALILITTVLGISYLVLPRIAAEVAGRDGWLAVLLAGMVVLALNAVFVNMARRFPGETIVEFAPRVFGHYPGVFLGWILFVYFLASTAFVTRAFADVAKEFLLPHTPLEVLIAALLFTAAYQVGHGLNILARISQIFFPVVILPLLLIMVLAQMHANYDEMLPFLNEGVGPVLKGIPAILRVYGGFGLMLFLTAFMKRPEQALKASATGLALPVILYLGLALVGFAVFGPSYSAEQVYPVMELARATEVPGAFLERFESLLLALLVFAAYSSTATYYYFATLTAGQLLGLDEQRPLILLLLPLVYILTLVPGSFAAVTTLYGRWLNHIILALVAVIGLMALMARLRYPHGMGGGDGV